VRRRNQITEFRVRITERGGGRVVRSRFGRHLANGRDAVARFFEVANCDLKGTRG